MVEKNSENYTSLEPVSTKFLFREQVIGSRRFSNYWWASIILIGSIGFFSVGISSFFQSTETLQPTNSLSPIAFASDHILFFPQGLVMCFYGLIGFFLSFYLWLVIFWNVGEGYNEFNKETGSMKLFRWGFPGKNRRIQLIYSMNDIEAIRLELKDGINPKRTLYVRIRGKNDIPLTRIGQPLTLEEIEKKAADLASFLKVSIENE